ncbi:MAG: intracellular septation protein [Rhodobacteraceae bacterium HLUCCA08]|nr:MAG: intracellular septation protein [Rhodobacteraceae bacterium HLUCCA08]
MSDAKTIPPKLKWALELGPTLAFLVLYFLIKDRTFTIGGTAYSGFIVATVIFIPVILTAIAVNWRLTGKLSRMQVFTAGMVIVFGGLTAYFNDERFFKMKTTIVYGLLASVLVLGLILRKSWLEYMMGDLIPMRHEGWMIIARGMAIGFAGAAVLNEVIWRTLPTPWWVTLESIALPLALFGWIFFVMMKAEPYLIEEEAGGDGPE